jgi:hypothetical protein
MTLSEVLYIVLVFYLGWKLSELYQLIKVKYAVERLLEARGLTLDEAVEAPEDFTILILEIEEVGDIKLLYDKEDNEFICQANTIEELAIRFNEQKKKSLGALMHNNNKLYFVNGKVMDKLSA